MNKIFQIGFNRCGTSSLYHFFKNNGLKSIHWDKGNLAKKILFNNENGKKLLDSIDDYEFYSDMEFVSNSKIIECYKMYEKLDNQYPNSLFILNTRDKENWIKSRLQHTNGVSNYITRYSDYYNLPNNKIIEMWSNDWNNHHEKVRKYFLNSSNFLEFNIENDEPEKLFNFLESNNIEIVSKKFEKKNIGVKC